MGIDICFFATTPGDLRAWALDRVPAWWAAWTDAPVDDCSPDDYDRVFGWWSRDECATLLAELAAVEGEPLLPRPISDDERRWLAEVRALHGDVTWAQASAELEARARTFIPWEDAAGLHAVRTVAARAHAMGCGLGFFLS